MPPRPSREDAHRCQLHHDAEELSQSVIRYVEDGLLHGQAVVVIAADDRIRHLEQHLVDGNIGPVRERLLAVYRSKDLLGRFMVQGMPDRARFREVALPILGKAVAAGFGPPRAYGEMVNDLWHDGNCEAAIRLEEFWNELLAEHDFTLFCGYVLDTFDTASYTHHLEAVCRCHTSIKRSENDDRARRAIDRACEDLIGFHPSDTLSHSQSSRTDWDKALPLSRRSVMWLKANVPYRLASILDNARVLYRDSVHPAPAAHHE